MGGSTIRDIPESNNGHAQSYRWNVYSVEIQDNAKRERTAFADCRLFEPSGFLVAVIQRSQ